MLDIDFCFIWHLTAEIREYNLDQGWPTHKLHVPPEMLIILNVPFYFNQPPPWLLERIKKNVTI